MSSIKEQCILPSEKDVHKIKFKINIVIHMIILFTILTVFFFNYISKISTSTFQSEIQNIISQNIEQAITNETKEKIKALNPVVIPYLNNIIEETKEPSEYVIEHNRWLKLVAFSFILISIFGTALIIYIYNKSCNIHIPIWHILLENLITFIFVGLVEFLFFTNIALKFVPAPPSLLISSFINKFKFDLISS